MKKKGRNKIVRTNAIVLLLLCMALATCSLIKDEVPQHRMRVIIDSDTNNELDDQHAIAYMLFNGHRFDVEGITVNRTFSGGGIDDHVAEANRVVQLCGQQKHIKVYKGASGNFNEIIDSINAPEFDGSEAVNFIIERAMIKDQGKLVLLAIGKLTNIALALKKEPSIAANIKIVWLGSNYPDAGEYNLINDTVAVNDILQTDVDFEIVTVRLDKPTGAGNVIAYLDGIFEKMPGKGPTILNPVADRYGNLFNNFGDYSLRLFKIFPGGGEPKGRVLYDVAAVAILKNPSWAERVEIPVPQLLPDGSWVSHSQEESSRKIIIWEDFKKKKIIRDFYKSMDNYVLHKDNVMVTNVSKFNIWLFTVGAH